MENKTVLEKRRMLIDAVQRALKIENAALQDLFQDYSVHLSASFMKECEESAEYAAIISNIKCYEEALKENGISPEAK